jgi:hypothetical protein
MHRWHCFGMLLLVAVSNSASCQQSLNQLQDQLSTAGYRLPAQDATVDEFLTRKARTQSSESSMQQVTVRWITGNGETQLLTKDELIQRGRFEVLGKQAVPFVGATERAIFPQQLLVVSTTREGEIRTLRVQKDPRHGWSESFRPSTHPQRIDSYQRVSALKVYLPDDHNIHTEIFLLTDVGRLFDVGGFDAMKETQ